MHLWSYIMIYERKRYFKMFELKYLHNFTGMLVHYWDQHVQHCFMLIMPSIFPFVFVYFMWYTYTEWNGHLYCISIKPFVYKQNLVFWLVQNQLGHKGLQVKTKFTKILVFYIFNMIAFRHLFNRTQSVVIGMVHLRALPGMDTINHFIVTSS